MTQWVARQYTRVVVGTLFALAVSVAAFNVVVDAHALFGAWLPEHVLGHARDHESRASRAELLHRGGWEVVVLGSSRVHVGIDPGSPEFGGRRVLNLGLANTHLCELSRVAEQVVADSDASVAYWFVELEQFDAGCRAVDGLGSSRFDPDFDRAEHFLENALGYRATLATLALLRDSEGVRTDATGAMHETRALPDPERAWDTTLRSSHHGMQRFTLSGEKLAMFEDIGRTLLDAGIDLRVVYSPVHVSLLEIQHVNGLEDDVEQFLRGLTKRIEALAQSRPDRIVELWDFGGYRGDALSALPRNDENPQNYRDPSHFRPAAGARVIGAMEREGRDPEDEERVLGYRLTNEDIEALLARRRSERSEYAAAHRDEVARLHAIIGAAATPRPE